MDCTLLPMFDIKGFVVIIIGHLLMVFDIQGNCFCESSGSGFGKAKVLYCYGEVRTMVMMMMVMTFLLR